MNKCDKCKYLSADKYCKPCSMCADRPHDLVCYDNVFESSEPKVLTSIEIWREPIGYETSSKPAPIDIRRIQLAEENGRVKEWQRPEQEKLRDAVKKVILRPNYEEIHEMRKTLENLKPPYKK